RARKATCDEEKPFCGRCTRIKARCGGYPKPRLATPHRRPLLPKSSEGGVVLWCPIAARLFESAQDFRCCRIFSRKLRVRFLNHL
ncbi:uncharacterized protein K444DRAFT_543059, partial [Hyaloscypha bicolor E]